MKKSNTRKKEISKKEVMKKLKEVIDPETGIDVVKMGMIKKVEIEKDKVKIYFTPTSIFCPLTGFLAERMKEKVKELGVEVEIEVTI